AITSPSSGRSSTPRRRREGSDSQLCRHRCAPVAVSSPVAQRPGVVQPGGVGASDEAGAGQYHFDPATYLAMVLAEVPAYPDLQHHVAEAARGVDAGSILELGAGTGETAAAVLAVHPGARLVGIDESQPMLAIAGDRFPGADLRVQRLEDPLPE